MGRFTKVIGSGTGIMDRVRRTILMEQFLRELFRMVRSMGSDVSTGPMVQFTEVVLLKTK